MLFQFCLKICLESVQVGGFNIRNLGNGWLLIFLDYIRECYITSIYNNKKTLKDKYKLQGNKLIMK
jgi:hypothetical protein